jgi:hypothetical protein
VHIRKLGTQILGIMKRDQVQRDSLPYHHVVNHKSFSAIYRIPSVTSFRPGKISNRSYKVLGVCERGVSISTSHHVEVKLTMVRYKLEDVLTAVRLLWDIC